MYKLIRPLLFTLDPETVHNAEMAFAEFVGNSWLSKSISAFYNFDDDPRLKSRVFGLDFRNPVGNAAGFDKYGKMIDFLPALNFGFTEVGSITAQPRSGNPRPRQFRLPQDKGLINRMGLNNDGADKAYEKLQGRTFQLPLGINIAKTHDTAILGEKAIEDFCYSFKKLYPLGDYIALNISCPNTAEGKTFEDKSALAPLLAELKKIEASFPTKKPILVKISPDVSESGLDDILDLSEQHGIRGYIISNCASGRDNVTTDLAKVAAMGKGGLSGEPIRQKSTELIAYAYRHLRRPCIIGLGGIDSPEDAYEKIRAGASLVQLYAGLLYEGPGLVSRINRGLAKFLERDGFKNIAEAVGVDAKN